MKLPLSKRSGGILIGVTLSVAAATGLPFVAGAVGLDSAVGNCSTVGAESVPHVCPLYSAGTGGGGASHTSDSGLVAAGGIALAGAAATGGVAFRRRASRRSA